MAAKKAEGSLEFIVRSSLRATYNKVLQTLAHDEVVTWDKFTEVWKTLNCDLIYYSLSLFTGLYGCYLALVEEALIIAKDLWTGQSDFNQQINAFCVVAAMYLQQPFEDPCFYVKFVLNEAELRVLNQFTDQLILGGHTQVFMLMRDMLSQGAFRIRCQRRKYGLTAEHQDDLIRDLDTARVSLTDNSFHQAKMVASLNKAISAYVQSKAELKSSSIVLDELSHISQETVDLLQSIMAPKVVEPISLGESCDLPTEAETIETRRRHIKKRAFMKGGRQTAQAQLEREAPPKVSKPVKTATKRTSTKPRAAPTLVDPEALLKKSESFKGKGKYTKKQASTKSAAAIAPLEFEVLTKELELTEVKRKNTMKASSVKPATATAAATSFKPKAPNKEAKPSMVKRKYFRKPASTEPDTSSSSFVFKVPYPPKCLDISSENLSLIVPRESDTVQKSSPAETENNESVDRS